MARLCKLLNVENVFGPRNHNGGYLVMEQKILHFTFPVGWKEVRAGSRSLADGCEAFVWFR